MITVNGREFFRGGTKIGYIGDNHIFDHSGEKIGFCSSDHIYDEDGHKVAYIEGDYIYLSNSSRKIRLEDNEKNVEGGNLSNIERATVRVLLGD